MMIGVVVQIYILTPMEVITLVMAYVPHAADGGPRSLCLFTLDSVDQPLPPMDI